MELAKVMLYIYCKMLISPKKEEYYKIEKFITTYKTSKEIRTFDDTKIKNQTFHSDKKPI